MVESKKFSDINGWNQIKGNPLTKVGVFPYLGSQISPELDPGKIYYVYRPEEELLDPECVESFKLIPWVDEHAMLGDGMMPAERKGIQGIIGEEVYYEDGYLKGNVKIFSETMENLISNGKKELSIGYRCLYDLTPGIYNGIKYDAVQRKIRGNHLALVNAGRAGPDVAVLDSFKFTFDGALLMDNLKNEKDLKSAKDESSENTGEQGNSGGETLESLSEKIKDLTGSIGKVMEIVSNLKALKIGEKVEGDEEADPSANEAAAMDSKISMLTNKLTALEKSNAELKNSVFKTVISEVSERDGLVAKLSPLVGVFDHKTMTLDEVAKYGVKKLGLECADGQEHILLRGYLAAKQNSNFTKKVAADTALDNVTPLRKHLIGGNN